jgi:hypothetical protein
VNPYQGQLFANSSASRGISLSCVEIRYDRIRKVLVARQFALLVCSPDGMRVKLAWSNNNEMTQSVSEHCFFQKKQRIGFVNL